MKLRDKDTKKYLLSVAVSTFVSYVVTFISFLWESLLRYYRDYLRLYLLVECCYGFACLEVC
jgi:hypothetical protein